MNRFQRMKFAWGFVGLFMAAMAVVLSSVMFVSAVLSDEPRQTPVVERDIYKVVIATYSQSGCRYCAIAQQEWVRLKISELDRYQLELNPQQFKFMRVTGTPTTIIEIRQVGTGLNNREFARFNGVAKAEDIQAAVDRAYVAVTKGIPKQGDIREKPAEKAEAP